MLSVLILTKNEQRNIADCLASVAWSDDVIVFDSMSTDETVSIAQRLGARVVQREMDDWSTHQNWAVQNIEFRHKWVFYLDADERCDAELRDELLAIVGRHESCNAYRLRRKDIFLGRWLKHAQLYPTWLIRVFRPEKIRYERLVNPVAVVDGRVASLKGHLIHYPFSHGVRHWFERHNWYSDLESQDTLTEEAQRIDWRGLFSRDATRCRRARKLLAYRVPFRPQLAFLYLYLIRLGFLDGAAGYYYSSMRASYELMIDAKVREHRWRAQSAGASGGPSSPNTLESSQEQAS